MTKEEYVKTFMICGVKVELGLDDYGQCYFIEWIDKNGEKKSTGLGTYNFHYLEAIYALFDKKYKELWRKWFYSDEMSEEEKTEWKRYEETFDAEYKCYSE